MAWVPFQKQWTEQDCVPTTVLNGIARLFKRQEIPPLIVRQVYAVCLDRAGDDVVGAGTTSAAVHCLADWFDNYRPSKKAFGLGVERLRKRKARLDAVVEHLEDDGVVALRVPDGSGYHYVLAVHADDEAVFFFDPYRMKGAGDGHSFGSFEPEGYDDRRGRQPVNLRISREHLAGDGKYSLGPVREREMLLLWRD